MRVDVIRGRDLGLDAGRFHPIQCLINGVHDVAVTERTNGRVAVAGDAFPGRLRTRRADENFAGGYRDPYLSCLLQRFCSLSHLRYNPVHRPVCFPCVI